MDGNLLRKRRVWVMLRDSHTEKPGSQYGGLHGEWGLSAGNLENIF